MYNSIYYNTAFVIICFQLIMARVIILQKTKVYIYIYTNYFLKAKFQLNQF